MTITLTPSQEKVIQDAIRAGLVRSVDELIDMAIETLPRCENGFLPRESAVQKMQEFGKKHRLDLGEPVTREFLHEGHHR